MSSDILPEFENWNYSFGECSIWNIYCDDSQTENCMQIVNFMTDIKENFLSNYKLITRQRKTEITSGFCNNKGKIFQHTLQIFLHWRLYLKKI